MQNSPVKSKYDVVVVGGGPGGSTVATFLAKSGKQVLVLERAKFPRYHIGESLLSGTTELLRKLGVEEKMEAAGFIKKYGVEWVWGQNRVPWVVYFKDALATPYDFGYQVERGEFDELLLENAAEHGAEVLQGWEVLSSFDEGDRVAGVIARPVGTDESFEVRAKWVVDASGQNGVISQQKAKRAWDPHLRNMAVWSYWKNASRGEGIDSGNTFLPTFAEGWWWFIPLREQLTSIGMIVDRDNWTEARKHGAETFYENAIARTPELAERLSGAERVDKIHMLRDWSYINDTFYGPGYLACGDAACFIDPLFSTGVHLAMLSGYIGAATVNTLLEDPQVDENKVLAFYERQYRREFERLKEQVYFLYSGHAGSKEDYFWKARSIFGQPNVKPEKAFISLIAGSYEHRSWYRRFLNRLEVPNHLKQVVSGIFDGETVGPKAERIDGLLVGTDKWTLFDDFALDGLRLRPTKTIHTKDGSELPLTRIMERILDRSKNATEGTAIVRHLSQEGFDEQEVRMALSEAVSFGILKSTSQVGLEGDQAAAGS